jgi:hypothetical protein
MIQKPISLPDAPCKINNQATTLFEIIRGTHGNLFFFVGDNPSSNTISRLRRVEQSVASLKPHIRTHYIVTSEVDADNAAWGSASVVTDGAQHLQTVFGLRAPEIIYVRPDGYIGLRTQNLDGRGLLDYLAYLRESAKRSLQIEKGKIKDERRTLEQGGRFSLGSARHI